MKRLNLALPIHPVLFAAYPVLALFETNLVELNPDSYVRPLLISIAFGLVVFALAGWINHNWRKGAVDASLFILLFFTYGQIYHLIREIPGIGFQLARHRYLGPFYLIILIGGLRLIHTRLKNIDLATSALNLVGLVLVLLPVWQIGQRYAYISAATKTTSAIEASHLLDKLQPAANQPLPDIYYIILDMHTRADAMKTSFNYDETPFIDGLKNLGFYVADCSQPNYDYTQPSLTTGLNYNYIPDLAKVYQALGTGSSDPWILIKHSLVRWQLEQIGYKTVAFETTYHWTTLSDADIFLGLGKDSLSLQTITPFESMLIKDTAVLIATDSQTQIILDQMREINYPHSIHVETERFILKELPTIPDIPEPTFTFAHILIPHYPFVFRPDGSLQTDPGFFAGRNANPVDKVHRIEGYRDGVAFVDSQILQISKTILARSKTPPIIIIQGDHGMSGSNRYQILNAYYMNQAGEQKLYANISPVNSFRVVFDTYFGMNYPLLEDYSYKSGDWVNPLHNNTPRCSP
jgi:hypothetical protein